MNDTDKGDLYKIIADRLGISRQEAKLAAYKYMYGMKPMPLDQVIEAVDLEIKMLNGPRGKN
jgi:hypothetical protein